METVRRRQIINTQGGVVHFRLYSTLWSEGGLGWGGVLSNRDGWLWPWHQFPVSLFPVAPTALPPLLPSYQTTIAALWLGSQVESLQTTTSLGLYRQWAQGCTSAQQHRQSVRQPGHIVHHESLPMLPSTTTKHCWPMLLLKEWRSIGYDVTVKISMRRNFVQQHWHVRKSFIGPFMLLLQN